MRSMYWYALTPVVLVFGGLVFVMVPYLALAVFAILLFLALAKLTRAIVAVPYKLGRARRRHA
jgi:hypothetical protein